MFSDIDGQVRLEEELRRSRELLRATADAMLDPQVLAQAVRDGEGRIVDFVCLEGNRAACEYLGVGREELVGRSVRDFFPGVAEADFFGLCATVVETGAPLARDDVLLGDAATGTGAYFDVRASRVGDALGLTVRDVTGRHAAAAALAHSERLLRTVIDGMLDPQILLRLVCDDAGEPLDFVYEEVNRAACEYFSRSRQQLVGTGLLENSPRARDTVFGRYLEAVLTGEPWMAEDVPVTGDMAPSARYDISAVPTGDRRLSVTFRNVTYRHESQAALLQSEEQFRDIFEHSFVGHALTSPDGHFVKVNAALCRMLGYRPEEMEGADITLFTVPEDDEAMRRRVAAMVDGTSDQGHARRRYRAKDGSIRWGDVSSTLQRDADGQPLYFIGSVMDVTEQVAAAEQIARLQAMRDVAESVAHVGSFRLDLATLTSVWSPEVRRLLDVAPEAEPDFYGSVLATRVDPDDRERLLQALAQARGRGEMPTVEFRVTWRDGSEHVIRRGGRIECDEDGRPVAAVGYMQDVTGLRAAEATLRARQRDLEESGRRLEALNRELESFSYSVSHDLRAPLRAIDGFSQILVDDYAGVLDEEGLGHLERIRAGAQRMGRLIDDLLGFSRAGRVELRLADVDVSAAAAAVLDELAAAAPERRVEVSVRPGLRAVADPALLDVVLANLLGNAWKFTSGREPAHIELGARVEDGETVFFVRDDGAGFDMAYAGALFAPFSRLHTEDEFPGSGIGLAMVQRIVARHGGRVWAEGAVGEGATVYFTLPAAV